MLSIQKIYLIAFIILFFSCKKNVNVNQKIGNINLENNNLKYKEVYYSKKENKTPDHFFYGEMLNMHYQGITGFQEKEGSIYPGLQILVLDKNMDTIIFDKDLYKDQKEGLTTSLPNLNPQITLANPFKSNTKYKVYTYVWDKIGNGNFNTETKISVEPYDGIKIKNSSFKFKEIYLFSEQRKKVILDKKIYLYEKVYLIIEGLEGFSIKSGKAAIGATMSVTDKNGNKLFENNDLFGKENNTSLAEINRQLNTYITFSEKEKGNIDLHLRVKIWDKNDLGTSLDLLTNLILADH